MTVRMARIPYTRRYIIIAVGARRGGQCFRIGADIYTARYAFSLHRVAV